MAFDITQPSAPFVTVEVAPRSKSKQPKQPKPPVRGDSYDYVTEYYSNDGQWKYDAARRELGIIKDEVEQLIHWQRTNQAFWGPEQNLTAATRNAELRQALLEWRAKFGALGVDVERVLSQVFNSPVGRVWENDPPVKQLAREWAGI